MNQPSILYSISFKEPQAHYVELTMRLTNFTDEYLDLKMPVWTPGSYLIREYPKNVEQFQPTSFTGQAARFEKTNKNTWRVFVHGENISISYRLYGFETSVRTNFIDQDHAFLSPAGTFMYIQGYEHLPIDIEITLPESWSKISTALPKIERYENHYRAENIDVLFDSPIEIGNQDTWSFEVEGVEHEFAMVGGGNYDKDKISNDVRRIVEESTRIWGSNPNNYYLFITHNYASGSGGLEHLNSTVLGATRNGYTNDFIYKNYLSLVAHEYFHLWHVKRLRPKELEPFNYEGENYSRALWIMEGFTSYYDNLIIRRCGIRNEEEYLNMLAIDFNQVYGRPGHRVQSAEMASFDTWIKHYRPDENSQNSSISYYNKGAILSAAIDLLIIKQTRGQKRLDDILRASYEYFHLSKNRGFEIQEFQDYAESVVNVDLSEIFSAASQLTELEYNDYFNAVGYELIDINSNNTIKTIGIKTAVIDMKVMIKHISRDSGAWTGGLNVNDEIIAVDGYRVDTNNRELEFAIEKTPIGEVIEIMVGRDGLIRKLRIPVLQDKTPLYKIQRLSSANAEQRRLGQIWLSLDS